MPTSFRLTQGSTVAAQLCATDMPYVSAYPALILDFNSDYQLYRLDSNMLHVSGAPNTGTRPVSAINIAPGKTLNLLIDDPVDDGGLYVRDQFYLRYSWPMGIRWIGYRPLNFFESFPGREVVISLTCYTDTVSGIVASMGAAIQEGRSYVY